MPASGNNIDSTIITIRPNDTTQQIPLTRNSLGSTTVSTTQLDDREIFRAFHDSMKDIGKFRQYIYYLGTSCDITKLRNKIHKLKSRINRNFFHQRELIGKGAALIGSTKSELAIRRFEKCLCFTLASLNYYEDLLHKYSMLLVYFPLPTTDHALDCPHAVSLGFEDSTINADEVSFENHDMEDNETNRYIELLNHIQFVQTLRDEIEQIDIYQLRHHATSYSKDFVDNMHQYTTDLLGESSVRRLSSQRQRFRLRYYFSDDSRTSSFERCHRRKFVCILTVIISISIIIGLILAIIAATKRASTG